ncbi:hypothetical protein GobsT_17530 [Gemmata obscuriglobus]|uniref:Type II toxin-antitoxin system ParD family antitoxin n=1 Tax=Gemmata obscuriglobus TaxID=114 RepID=A0A2Z3H1H2_9BACT|nr:hypothetical protein [Gemmata obscuriglobus]AWM39873.1 hypothetical protein C1280_24585 [Gemmata obscuriglobus]QEG27001.1 hypothetical protein GobsT_17530 [Gemmata obscuriglobus]VTS03293.1 transcriptional regulator : Putative addiction module antidote protein, CC2985 family OS=Cylindrospermum stagnale PCC 7417 GN=Cylst_3464 PE=4 SV=1 [Gemmata obscuriglobus UQM 2246]
MTITLPDELKDELERKTRSAGFATVSEYVCWLVQRPEAQEDMTPEALGFASPAELETKLLASLTSGPPVRATPEFWNELRQASIARAASKPEQP